MATARRTPQTQVIQDTLDRLRPDEEWRVTITPQGQLCSCSHRDEAFYLDGDHLDDIEGSLTHIFERKDAAWEHTEYLHSILDGFPGSPYAIVDYNVRTDLLVASLGYHMVTTQEIQEVETDAVNARLRDFVTTSRDVVLAEIPTTLGATLGVHLPTTPADLIDGFNSGYLHPTDWRLEELREGGVWIHRRSGTGRRIWIPSEQMEALSQAMDAALDPPQPPREVFDLLLADDGPMC